MAKLISPHHHSGKRLGHHHTSYVGLIFVVLLSVVLAAAISQFSEADTTITAAISGPPPSEAARILVPYDGQILTSDSVTVSGTCPANTFVAVMVNGSFGGSSFCQNHLFEVMLSRLPTTATLIAKDYYVADTPGPDSAPVTVTVAAPVLQGSNAVQRAPAQSPPPAIAAPTRNTQKLSSPPGLPAVASASTLTILSPNLFFNDIVPGRTTTFGVTVKGGTAPYRWQWDWGDGADSHGVVKAEGRLEAPHRYSLSGIHTMIVTVTDALGQEAYIQLAAIVNGPLTTYLPEPVHHDYTLALILLGLIPLLAVVWWAERRQAARRPVLAP